MSASSRKKTVRDSRIEMHSAIFSPLSQHNNTLYKSVYYYYYYYLSVDRSSETTLAIFTRPPHSRHRQTQRDRQNTTNKYN